MPRIIRKRKKRLDTNTKIERRYKWNPRGGSRWVDPYPHILGTLPEKKVYAYLMQNGIPFRFQTWFEASIPEVSFHNWYRPDFILPTIKVIIEVQGAFFHSSPDQRDKDAFKYAIYNQLGWKVVQIWDYEIEVMNMTEIAMKEPYMQPVMAYSGPFRGEEITEHKEVRDDSAGIRKANALRKDYAKHVAKIKTRKTRKKSAGLSYVAR